MSPESVKCLRHWINIVNLKDVKLFPSPSLGAGGAEFSFSKVVYTVLIMEYKKEPKTLYIYVS